MVTGEPHALSRRLWSFEAGSQDPSEKAKQVSFPGYWQARGQDTPDHTAIEHHGDERHAERYRVRAVPAAGHQIAEIAKNQTTRSHMLGGTSEQPDASAAKQRDTRRYFQKCLFAL